MKLIYSIILTFLSISCAGQSIRLFQNNRVNLQQLQSLPSRNQFDLNGSSFNFEEVQLTTPEFSVIDSKSNERKVRTGKFYRDKTKNATLSVFGKSFVLVYDSLEVFNNGLKSYKTLPQRHFSTGCYTDDDSPVENRLETNLTGNLLTCRSVKIYFEADYKLFQEKGSVQATTDYIFALFNQVALLYANEQINVQISQIKVWNVPDPYIPFTNIGSVLNKFRTDLNGAFNGNLAHLLTTRSLGGGIAYVDVLCFKNYACGVSAIQTTFKNVPIYSWSVEVIAHELGHNFGSWHTHSCNWSSGPIDNCYPPEGTCNPGSAPVNGGTIMSYCHLTQYGINFNNGFGLIPGNWIRQKYNNATCLNGSSTPPTNLTATNITSNSVQLSWNQISGAVYELQWKKTTNSQWNIISNININSYSLGGLEPSTQYDWKVKTDCSTFTSVQSFITLPTVPPFCPVITNITITNITQTTVKVNWPIVNQALTYNLQYKLLSAVNWIEYSGIPSNFLNLTNLAANSTYQVKVRPDCNQTYSTIVQFSTSTSNSCLPPADLYVTNLTSTSARFSWNPVAGATSYQIALKFPGSNNFFTIGQLFTNTYVNFYGFEPNSTYQWKVKTNCSDWSVINIFTTPSQMPAALTVFPNPAHGSFNIVGNTATAFQLFDLRGQLKREGVILDNVIDVTDLPSGMYFLKIDDQILKIILF